MHSVGLVVFAVGLIHEMGSLYARFAADEIIRVAFHNSATMEWLCIWINFIFNLIFFLVSIILVSLSRSSVDPSLAGLAATYILNINVLQALVIWNF
ncbi:hypothetical protein ACJW30_03G130100 [Castanea mollissima]